MVLFLVAAVPADIVLLVINIMGMMNVLITGGSSGIGLSLAKKYVSKGLNVWILGRSKEKLIQSLNVLENHRISNEQKIDIIQADVSDSKALNSSIEKIIIDIGSFYLLINSAGAAHPGVFNELPLDIFRSMMEVNYFGTLNTIKAVLPAMIENKRGHIVNISSIAGFLGIYGYTAYSASKFAVRGFSDCLRSELRPLGIDVSIVFPPDTQTPQLEYENQYKPEITKMIAGNAGISSPDFVADAIISGVENRKYIIIPGIEGKIIFHLNNFLGPCLYPILDIMVNRAKKSS